MTRGAGVHGGSLLRESALGCVLVGTLVLGLGLWATTTHIAAAVVAPGTLVVSTSAKRVQHQEGGRVAEIHVNNEDRVEAGQVLLRLDSTALRASLAVVTGQLNEAMAVEARLIAEVAEKDELELPSSLEANLGEPTVLRLVSAQADLMRTRSSVRTGEIAQSNQQIAQFRSRIEGLSSQLGTRHSQLELVNGELADLSNLSDQQLVARGRVNEFTKEKIRLEGEIAGIRSQIRELEFAVDERRIAADQVQAKFLSEAMTQLQGVRERIAELLQQKIVDEDRLAQVDIVAPQAGIVHESVVHTVGGVISPGETLMLIVPTEDELVLDVRISPLDVENVSVGQEVIVRIAGTNPRTTPDISGRLDSIAPDLTDDPRTGEKYFTGRIALDPEKKVLGRDSALKVTAGMVASAFIQTGERTVMAYLLKPLTDQFQRAMLEP